MTTVEATRTPREAWTSAERIKAAWRAGAEPNAAAALLSQPELAHYRSVVIDLAYEEYLQRERGGAAPDPTAFAREFPDFQASVQQLIEAHVLLVEQPDLLPTSETDWPEVGGTIEGLELRRELGRGTFGRAYLAFDPSIGRLRVLKVAPGGAAEAKVIGGLRHDHVIDVLWTRPVGPRIAVCMPFVGAATLVELLDSVKGRTPSAESILETAAPTPDEQPETGAAPVVFARDAELVAAAAVGAKIAHAVAYLHSKCIVHGDVKPSNVVLQPGGSPVVIDFNLAAGDEPAIAIRGTPSYMAPEQLDAMLAGRRPHYDGEKADAFSLGVTLLELLQGRHPYQSQSDGTLASLAIALRKCDPRIPGLPATLTGLLKACLAVDPASRPTAKRMAAELDRFVQRSRTRSRRNTSIAATAVGALLTFGLSLSRLLKNPS